MTKTHWKKLTNPDYLGAYAFDPGEEKTVTIRDVDREMVTGAGGKKEDCTVIHLYDEKPMIANATNQRAIQKLIGSPYIEDWIGKSIILKTMRVQAFGETTDAVRVKPQLPVLPTCEKCGKQLTPFGEHGPFLLAKVAREKFGKTLCVECAKSEKQPG